jgi:RNA polymerase sigma-70 factor, ECF subfamily
VEEIQQQLRQKLLHAPQGGAAKISSYSGRGALERWLRAAAVRLAVNRQQRAKAVVAIDDVLPHLAAVEKDPELRAIRKRCGAALNAALRDSFQMLTLQERNLLRMHIVEKLSASEIARHYQTHRVTIGRWLDRARLTLLEETRRRLSERLNLGRAEFESLLGVVRSELDISLNRVLRHDAP